MALSSRGTATLQPSTVATHFGGPDGWAAAGITGANDSANPNANPDATGANRAEKTAPDMDE
jgi:hypothetical protein